MAHDPTLNGLCILAIGLGIFGYGLFLSPLRRSHMRRVQSESGASMEQVEAWFRPSHGWLSDVFKRGAAIGIAYPLIAIGAGMILSPHLHGQPGPANTGLAFLFGYSLGFSLLFGVICFALLWLVCAERLGGSNIVMALSRNGYDYEKARRDMGRWGRSGLGWSLTARIPGLILLGIALFIGSLIVRNLSPHVQAWFGH